MIEISHVWKRYGSNVILENISATVEEGEFITLVGASGCGKSTFLRMLLGTESPSQGEIKIDGKPIPDEPDAERGVVFQQYSVFPHLTVLENVAIARAFEKTRFGFLFGNAKRAAREEAAALLDIVGLSHMRDRYPDELSGGMRQRLAIAQALILKPRILLLDEPFGALDPGIRADMHDLVLDLWRKHKLTVFMVTHDLKEGFHLGTRLWVFDKLRVDPQSPNAYGAGITYDLPVGETGDDLLKEIDESLSMTSTEELTHG